MTHNELLKEIDRYLVPTLAESEVGNKAIGILKALRAVVELHKPSNKGSSWMPLDKCDICIEDPGDYQPTQDIKYPCLTIQAIEKELA